MRVPAPTSAHASDMIFREVTQTNWCDLEALFESRGGPKACWCMVWRNPKRKGEKAALKEYVDAKIPIGLLGYADGAPVAWCSIAPRSAYRAGLAKGLPGDEDENVWSLACFFVQRKYRHKGVFGALVAAARDHAAAHGATILEAYPVDPDSPSYLFCGFLPPFERLGFVEVGREGLRRHVVRQRIAPPAT